MSVVLREERRVRVFEGCRAEYLDLIGRKKRENGENCISFIRCTPYQILLGRLDQGR
jgi:hypothetical protein